MEKSYLQTKLLRVSDCEELVGVTFRGMMGLVLDRADFQGLPEREVPLNF